MRIDGVSLGDLQFFNDPDGRGGLLALFVSPETRAGRSALRSRLTSPKVDPTEIRPGVSDQRLGLQLLHEAEVPAPLERIGRS